MKSKKFLLFSLLVCIIAWGCKKKSDPQFSVQNDTDADMNVNVYASETDYVNGTNVVVSGKALRHSAFNFPASKLKTGGWYYVDAFSSDYSYTNWVNGDSWIIGQDSTTPRRFKYTGATATFGLGILASGTNARMSLLANNRSGSKWRAIDALDLSDGSEIWFGLTDAQRYAEITVNKSDTGRFYYISGTDTFYTQFTFGDLVGYPLWDIIPNETGTLFFMTNTYVNPAINFNGPPCIDSAVALINGNLYILAREN